MIPKDEVDLAIAEVVGWSHKAARVVRGFSYFIIAALLLSAGPYEHHAFWTVAFAIGLLGVMGASAKIGQMCLAILAVLAVLPPTAVAAISEAL